MKDILKLAENLKVKFKNSDLLLQAVTHRSYLNEHRNFKFDHNERLEFLGDAVVELVVTDYLYNNYPNPEGELTNWRASLVNAKMLAKKAKELEVEDFIQMSRGETKDRDSKAREYILANAFEAVVGAIYLDGGYKTAEEFISRVLFPELTDILENELYRDPKSKFQEKAQELFTVTPHYEVMSETGPDHAKKFKVGLYISKEFVAEGNGTSKQEAQEDAARTGLKAKGW